MTQLNRRKFMSTAGGLAATVVAAPHSALSRSVDTPSPTQLATGTDPNAEKFWEEIRRDFDRPAEIINLEHGYWTEMSRPVRRAFEAHTARINRDGAFYARRHWDEDKASVEARLAGYLGCKPSEIALTRNASEALQALIGGYQRVGKNDAVLYADLDYGSVKQNFETLASTRGAKVVKINLPEPATRDNVIAAYEEAIDANPQIKLMVLTQVSNQTGLLLPVRDIIAKARERGVDVVVDAAHSFGQLNVSLDTLGADFAAFNLHKWIGAPIGVGFVYIREDRLADIAMSMSQSAAKTSQTAGRVYYGTMNFATALTVHDALDYNDRIGWQRKFARLKVLRDAWAEPARSIPGVEILTSTDPDLSSAITSFRITGRVSVEQNIATVERLLDEHGIFTVHRVAPAKGACIRVTPSLANVPADCERLVAALTRITST